MNKKGQAAMEFLMTYGWAILVVIAAIAALAYFGVLDPARLMPDRCQFPAGMDCIGKASIDGAANEVTFALRNNIGFPADVTGIIVTTTSGTCAPDSVNVDLTTPTWIAPTPAAPVRVSNNAVLQVKLSGCAFAEDKYQGTISVEYVDTNTGLNQKAAGEIRGRVA